MRSPDRTGTETDLKYKTIFESDVVGVTESQMDGRILNANDYFLKMMGYSREELERGELNWYNLTAPEFKNQSLDLTQKLKTRKSISSFEKQYIHKDGSLVFATVNMTLHQDGTILAIILDITQQKRTEKKLAEFNTALEERFGMRTQELQRSESFLEAIFENIPNMVFVKDADQLRFIRFNKAGEALIGQPREEMIGKNDYDYFPKDQADFFVSKDREVLQQKRVVDIPEEAIQTARGVRYLHTKKIPIFDKNDKAEYLLGVSEDITEKKEAEQQRFALLQEQIARESAEARAKQMSFLSEITSALTASFDLRTILQGFSRNVISFMADICIVDLLNEENTAPAHCEVACKNPADQEPILEMRRKYPVRWDDPVGASRVLRTGKSELIQDLNQKSTHLQGMGLGMSISSLMFVPVRLRDQKPMGVVTFILKNTKKSYNEIDLSLAEEIIKRLAVAVENSRLYYNAQEASRAKSSFLATMSHEIRTPLNAIVGFASLLLDSHLSYDQKDYIKSIRTSSNTLLSLINDILDVSKIEAGKLVLESTEFELRALYTDIVDIVADSVAQKKLELVSYIDPKVPRLLTGDPARIKQIILNLLNNAIKFTHEGSISVQVKIVDVQNHKLNLRFEIQDTGIGIAPELLNRLFKPFMQADSSTTRRYGGTGLGLSISKQLVDSMGGDIGVTSIPQKGSSFWFQIQLEAADMSPVEAQLPKNLQGRDILFFTECPALRQSLENQLRDMKLNPIFPSPTNMLLSRPVPPLAIILDQSYLPFPVKEKTQVFKNISGDAEVPIIYLVERNHSLAHLSPIQRINYLKKPLLQQNLYKCFQEVLHLVDLPVDEPPTVAHIIPSKFGAHRPRVLLVEDNPINQRVALLMLKKIGCNVDVAANGGEALKALQLLPYDLIFMDCQMPEMDGYEATRSIRKLPKPLSDIPIIALTANAFKEDQAKCLEAGMNGFVTKPVDAATLEEKLLQYVRPATHSPDLPDQRP